MTSVTESKINELFDKLVPSSGAAPTVAGEIVRAIALIGYRNYNDGDHIGCGYGKETCNPAARFLSEKCGPSVKEAVYDAWGIKYDEDYDKALAKLETAVLEYLEEHPELQTTANEEDMWDYRTDEDVDNDWDEEEDY